MQASWIEEPPMKHFVFAAIIGAVAAVPSVADAQSHRDGSRGHSHEQRYDRGRDHRRDHQRGNNRAHQRAQPRSGHRTVVHHAPPRHRAPPRQVTRVVYAQPRPVYRDTRWQRGHYLPAQYRGGGYYVDHRHYRLAPPPPGHRYVRIDGDAVLIGVATGLITAVLAGAFH